MAEKKILCNLPNRDGNKDPECKGVLAHLISERMIKIGRGEHRISFTVTDGNASCVLTCPVCKRLHTLIWRHHKLDESVLTLEDVTPKPNGDPDDPNNPNNPGQNPGGNPAPSEDPPADSN